MTRRGLLAPLLATVATAACAPMMGEGLLTPAPLGPPGWRRARAAYGPDPRQTLRLYRPARAQGAPILIVFPDGTPAAEDERIARDLAERGFVVAVADWRAAPDSAFPAFIGDAATAVGWISKRAHDLDAYAGRIGVLGIGEGGRAALMLALDRRYLAAAKASGAVRAAAALGAPEGRDATFTDPSAYAAGAGTPPVWRGDRGDLAGAFAFLQAALG